MENSNLKYDEELSYWKERYTKEGAKLGHAHYKQLMLAISGESENFFSDKIVADFGCGPRGSLQWMTNAKMRIGIDVLVDQYMELGIAKHNVTYVRSSETEIPLPTGYLNVIFTINSIDHVSDVDRMLDEIFRVLRPGGLFAASLNLDEPPTPTEPATLTEDFIYQKIVPRLHLTRCKVAPRYVGGDTYKYLIDWAVSGLEPASRSITKYGIAWIAGEKK
jgi:ubiquinone/menaquinone biosynthesis C-methylase UbiE